MSLYLPRAFDERDLAHLDALAAEYPLATVVTVADGEPFVSHLPLICTRQGSRVELRGHFARSNPQWRHAGTAVAIFNGPQAYVSPSWYPDKAEKARVPTWNYVVAHLSGPMHTFDDEPSLADLVAELSQLHEARTGSDWRFDRDNEAEHSQLRGIVGFRITVERIALKAKLSQNHPTANRQAVIEQLERASGDDARNLARWMREAAPSTEGA